MRKIQKLGVLALSAVMVVGSLSGCTGDKTSADAGQETAAAGGEQKETSEGAVTFSVTADVTGDRAPYVEQFAKLVEEKTDGRYVGNVIAAGSLGSGADAAQMLQMGTLDILMSDDMTVDGVLDGKLGFAWLPGLVENEEEAKEIYDYGWIADQVSEIMAENKLIRLSSYSNGQY